MFSSNKIAFMIVGSLLLLSACSPAAQSGASNVQAQAQAKTVTLTAQDNGTTVELAAGDTLVVSLSVISGTGYSWAQVSDLGGILASTGDVTTPKNTSPGLTGGEAQQDLTFSAVAAGTTKLSLEYRPPFDTSAVADTFEVQVEVK